MADRVILHVDMDAFFASIAQLDDPSLRGKAVLVGGDGPRGVVTAASYPARKYGCRSAMPMATAKRLCPHAIVTQVPRERIRELSGQMRGILAEVSPVVEPVSVDEAYIDATGCDRLFYESRAMANYLKERIREQLGLTASIGVSFNKALAKIASDLGKPDGLAVIEENRVAEILSPMPVGKLHGVGPTTEKKLHSMGLRTIGDLRQQDSAYLERRLGKLGSMLHRLAWGMDDRPVTTEHQARSMGQEQTFSEDVAELDALYAALDRQIQHVARRLRQHRLQARGVTLKLRFGDFRTITRSTTLTRPSDLAGDLWPAAKELLQRWSEDAFEPVRLLGVSAGPLQEVSRQLELFPQSSEQDGRQLERLVDQIASRFGSDKVWRGLPW